MSTWYYAGAERQQLGPVTTDELKQFFRNAHVGPDTLVWRDGMLHWRPLHELAQQLGLIDTPPPPPLAERAPVGPPSPPPPPAAEALPEPAMTLAVTEPAIDTVAVPAAPAATPEITRTAAANDSARPAGGRAVFNLGTEPSPVPAYVRPSVAAPVAAAVADGGADANPYAAGYAPLQGRASVASADQDVVYAGFWKRAAAAIIDGVIMSIAGGLCAELFGALLADIAGGGKTAEVFTTLLMTLLINACYYAWFHSTLNFATPGKMAVGIKLVRGNGDPASFLRAFARYFAMALSAIPLGLGYIMAGFTQRKQALHDMVCDTLVVDKWAFTSQPEQQNSELGTVTIVVLALYALLMVLLLVLFFVAGFSALSRF